MRDRVEETCELAKSELAKIQTRNKNYYDRRTRERKLNVGDSVLLLLPTERNKLTLAWRGPYKVAGIVGEVDYRIEMNNNMLKRYFRRDGNKLIKNSKDSDESDEKEIHQAASVFSSLRDRRRARS